MACLTFSALFRIGADLKTTSIWKRRRETENACAAYGPQLYLWLNPRADLHVCLSSVWGSPWSWSVSTWSACLIFSADWYKKTGFSSRTGCCLPLPKRTQTAMNEAPVTGRSSRWQFSLTRLSAVSSGISWTTQWGKSSTHILLCKHTEAGWDPCSLIYSLI